MGQGMGAGDRRPPGSQTTLDFAVESVVVVVKDNYCKETFVKVVKQGEKGPNRLPNRIVL